MHASEDSTNENSVSNYFNIEWVGVIGGVISTSVDNSLGLSFGAGLNYSFLFPAYKNKVFLGVILGLHYSQNTLHIAGDDNPEIQRGDRQLESSFLSGIFAIGGVYERDLSDGTLKFNRRPYFLRSNRGSHNVGLPQAVTMAHETPKGRPRPRYPSSPSLAPWDA